MLLLTVWHCFPYLTQSTQNDAKRKGIIHQARVPSSKITETTLIQSFSQVSNKVAKSSSLPIFLKFYWSPATPTCCLQTPLYWPRRSCELQSQSVYCLTPSKQPATAHTTLLWPLPSPGCWRWASEQLCPHSCPELQCGWRGPRSTGTPPDSRSSCRTSMEQQGPSGKGWNATRQPPGPLPRSSPTLPLTWEIHRGGPSECATSGSRRSCQSWACCCWPVPGWKEGSGFRLNTPKEGKDSMRQLHERKKNEAELH